MSSPRRILVLAHVPPPFHGQSYMVRVLLDCFNSADNRPSAPGAEAGLQSAVPAQGTRSVKCVHVDFRLSNSIEDIGQRPWTKLFLVLRYCGLAILGRFREGADTLLYVPAPGLRHAIYRDWLVMACCRPFFRQRVLWWHAAGLGGWLRNEATPLERWITRHLLARPDMSLVLGAETERDATELASRRIAVVPNAIPDPCPHVAPELVRHKAARRASQQESLDQVFLGASRTEGDRNVPSLFRLLFIGLCYRQKGLFDAVEAVSRANRRLAQRHAWVRVQLDVAGRFFLPNEQQEFEDRIRQPDLSRLEWPPRENVSEQFKDVAAVRYHGFVAGDAKERLFRVADCLIFPTYYSAESFGLVLLEAMAHGLDVIATRWHHIPELLPRDYPGLVNPQEPDSLDAAIELFLRHYEGDRLRRHYELHFTMEGFKTRIQNALDQLGPT